MPAGLVRFALVRREYGFILFISCQRYGILSVRLQPLVKFVLIEDVTFARLGGWYRTVTEFHVQRP